MREGNSRVPSSATRSPSLPRSASAAPREQPAQLGGDRARLLGRAGRDQRVSSDAEARESAQPSPSKPRLGDALALDAQAQRDAVAAERVVDARLVCRRGERPDVPRARVVLEDDALVELPQRPSPGVLRNIRPTRSSARPSASISAVVL